jgi:argininosuccinate lyase
MPQKKNPYGLTFVRGVARHLTGTLVSVIATNSTPSGQPDNRIFAYGEVPRVLESATRAIRLMAGTLDRATFDRVLMARRAAEDYSGATDLGDYLSEVADLDPRTAHRIIGLAVRYAGEKGEAITAALLDRAGRELIGKTLGLPEEMVARAQDPQEIVNSRTGIGGASEGSVRAMIEDARRHVSEFEAWIDNTRRELRNAEADLLQVAQAIAEATPE